MSERAVVERQRPWLVLFHSSRSGLCRRIEGFLAQVLQRRRNHETFALYRVDVLSRPDLAAKFGVERVPTLVVVEDGRVSGRLEQPKGCRAIEQFLAGWLRAAERGSAAKVVPREAVGIDQAEPASPAAIGT